MAAEASPARSPARMKSTLALYNAAKSANYEAFSELFYRKAAEADVDYKGEDGATALRLACESGNREIAELLVGARCDVDLQDGAGWSPLYAACSGGQLALVQLLLQAGALLEAPSLEGATPLYVACLKVRYSDI
jgi:ankyrin repeat protein